MGPGPGSSRVQMVRVVSPFGFCHILWPWFYCSRSIWFISWRSVKPDHGPNLATGRSRGAASESSEAHMWHTRSATGQSGRYRRQTDWTKEGERGYWVSTCVNSFYIITSVKTVCSADLWGPGWRKNEWIDFSTTLSGWMVRGTFCFLAHFLLFLLANHVWHLIFPRCKTERVPLALAFW